MAELAEPPRITMRRLPSLLAESFRLAWAAAPRELLLVGGLQAVAGLGLALPILAGRELAADLVAADRAAQTPRLLVLGALLLALVGLLNLAGAVAAARDELLSELLQRHAQRRILDVACAVDLERFEEPAFHNRLERASMSAAMRPHQLAQGLSSLVQALLGTAGVALALAAINPLLMLATLLAGVPLWLAGIHSGHVLFATLFRLTPAERERGYLITLFTGRSSAKEVRAYGLAPYLRARWEARTGERLGEIRATVRRRLRITLVSRLAGGAALGAVLGVLMALALTDRMAAPDAVAAVGAVLMLGARLRVAAAGTDQLFEAAPFVEDLRAFLEAGGRGAAGSAGGPVPPAAFQRLTVEDLAFTYPSGDRPALRGVDLEINAGEVVALVGANGSGKTTLAKLLCHLYTPQRGRIRYDGVDVTGADRDRLMEPVAMLFQDFQRYLLPAADNIAAGRWSKAGDRRAVAEAAALAHADTFLSALPQGYDSLLGPEFAGGTDLSGGQWQRVALARAFFRDAPFLILDEPTATLDAQAEHDLFERLRALLAGRTVLLISHRFATVRTADRIYVMDEGRVIEHGSHDELMAAGGRYRELFTLQAAAYGP